MDMWKMISDTFGFDLGMKEKERPTAIGFEHSVSNDGDGNYTAVYVVYFTNKEHSEEFGDLEYFDEKEDAEEFAILQAKAYKMKYVGEYDDSPIPKPKGADRIVIDENMDGDAVVYFADGPDQLTDIVGDDNESSKAQAMKFAQFYADKYKLPIYDLL